MKSLQVFFAVWGVAVLIACGGTSDATKKMGESEAEVVLEKDIEEPKDSLTLARERREEEAAVDKIWRENDLAKLPDLFDSLGMTHKQINRFVIESRNNEAQWREENPDKVMTLPERRANRDKTMFSVLNPAQMNEYLKWTQKIDSE